METMVLDALRLFLSQYKPTSRRSYQNDLKHVVDFIGHTRPIHLISPIHIAEYSEVLEKKGYAISTWNKRVKATHTFFNWAVKFGLIEKSPARAFKTRSQRGIVSRDKVMPEDDFEALLNYARVTRDKRLVALILFCGDTGCRRGGVAGLRWEHLNVATREAVVTEKGNASRPVAFGEVCAEALVQWQALNVARVYVFSVSDNAMTAAAVSQLLRRACKRAGIKGRGVHALRHRKGYQFADKRISPAVAQAALGHTHVTTTLQHYYPQDWHRAKEALDELSIKTDKPAEGKLIKPTFKKVR
jgi:integrase/recombinase XerD